MATEAVERIQEIINKADEEIRSVEVQKHIPLEFDVGNLITEDNNLLDKKIILDFDKRDELLLSLARDGVQALLSKVWDLPSKNQDGMIFATLPAGTTRIPREKRLPKGSKLTRWQKYASDKGFNQRKKTKKIWDETLKRWVPRFGYRKVQAEKEKNWVKEVPGNADPYEDQFEKAATVKKEGIAKNEYKRLKNIARGRNIKLPSVGVTNNEFASTQDLGKAMHLAHHATASIGKFQNRIPKEKTKIKLQKGKKRKLNEVIGGEEEKRNNLEIIKKLGRHELNLEGAVRSQIKAENFERATAPSEIPGRRSKAGGRHRGKSEQSARGKGKGKGTGMFAPTNKGAQKMIHKGGSKMKMNKGASKTTGKSKQGGKKGGKK